MPTSAGPNIIENGLVLALDAADRNSYPGTGTTWYDLTSNKIDFVLTNGPVFNSGSNGSIQFDGSNDLALNSYTTNSPYNISLTGKMTWDYWARWSTISRLTYDGGIAFGAVF